MYIGNYYFSEFLWRFLVKKKTSSISELPAILKILLNRGYNGSTLVVTEQESEYFIQYSKYIIENGSFGIQLDFPKAKWSSEFYIIFEKYLKKNNIEYKISAKNQKNELLFISVDFNQNINLASSISIYIINNVMKLSTNARYQVEYNRVSEWDEVISSNNQKKLSTKEGFKTLNRPGFTGDSIL